jgi:hypothetical protein
MYPPMGKNVGVVESIYTFRKGLRRRGGVATLMARAVLRHSLNKGLSELRTQVHRDNTAAHRWAARLGWQPIGEVIRLSVDLRGLRGHYLYLHTRALSPQSSPSFVERGYEQNIAPPTHAPSPSVSLEHDPQQGVVGQS